MTLEELARFNGKDGRPAYVAVNGKIYDFSASALWKDGDHKGLHRAGTDLTEALTRAPHVRALIERFPLVGMMEEKTAAAVPKSGKLLLMAAILIILIMAAVFMLGR